MATKTEQAQLKKSLLADVKHRVQAAQAEVQAGRERVQKESTAAMRMKWEAFCTPAN